MHLLATLIFSLLAIFSLSHPASAHEAGLNTKGINCHGARHCKWNMLAMAQIQWYLHSSPPGIDPNRMYDRNQLIVCDYYGLMCAYLKNSDEQIIGKRAEELLDALWNHGCKACGSIPLSWPENDPPRHHRHHSPELSVNRIGTGEDALRGYIGPVCRGICEVEEWVGIPFGQPKTWPEYSNHYRRSEHVRRIHNETRSWNHTNSRIQLNATTTVSNKTNTTASGFKTITTH